jgi:hypothetical protein
MAKLLVKQRSKINCPLEKRGFLGYNVSLESMIQTLQPWDDKQS